MSDCEFASAKIAVDDVIELCRAKILFLDECLKKRHASDLAVVKRKWWVKVFYRGASDESLDKKFVDNDHHSSRYVWARDWYYTNAMDIVMKVGNLAVASRKTNPDVPGLTMDISAETYQDLMMGIFGYTFEFEF